MTIEAAVSRRPDDGRSEAGRANAIRFAIVSRLADDLAHEIKNPLHSMVINLEVLRRRSEKGDGKAVQERVVVLEHEIDRLHHLVDGLLQLLRPGKDGSAPASLRDAVGGIWPLLELRARLAEVELRQPETLSDQLFTSVSRGTLRLALLGLSESATEAARRTASALTLAWQADAAYFVVGFSLERAAREAAAAGTMDRAIGFELVSELLAGSGASVETNVAGSYLIRVPALTTLT